MRTTVVGILLALLIVILLPLTDEEIVLLTVLASQGIAFLLAVSMRLSQTTRYTFLQSITLVVIVCAAVSAATYIYNGQEGIHYLAIFSWLVMAVAVPIACAYLAHEKNRSWVAWGLLSMIFNPFALLILLLLPSDVKEHQPIGEAAQDITTLLEAARYGLNNQVQALLTAGAHLNERDEAGVTALIWASKEGHLETVKILLDSGSDVSVRDNIGRTALIAATQNGHTEIIDLLKAAGAKE